MLKTKKPKLEIELLADDAVTHMTSYLSSSEAYFFAKTCPNYRKLWLSKHQDKAQTVKKFFQAVIDDKQEQVKKILEEDPWVLLEIPSEKQTLKSEYTHHIINVEGFTGLQVALLRDQLEMTKLILPYFNQIREGHQEALNQWEVCEKIKEAKKERIKAYVPKMKKLIEDIAGKTEQQFDEVDFRNGLLPKEKAIYLDEYVDIEALLLSAYQGYNEYLDTFQNWYQRDVFAIKVIGFLQSLVSPETAKVFCEGLYYVVEEERKPGEVAKSLKLVDEPSVSFYRTAADWPEGLGFDFLIGGGASVEVATWKAGVGMLWRGVGKFCQSKTSEFCRLKRGLKRGFLPTFESEPVTQNSCLLQ